MRALELRHVTYTLTRVLLDDVTMEFHPGELTALSGPSGSGKTTLLSIAGGLVAATEGVALYDGRPVWQGSGDPRPEVAFVLQVYGLVPVLSAHENVSIALRARGVDPTEADERAETALARFHIADLGDRQVEELSGGQMQRVACARALVVGAPVLLADEPTSELDEGNRTHVLAELRAEADRGSIVVVATHDPAVVAVCDRHYALDEGRVVLAEAVAQAAPAVDEPEPARPAADLGARHRGPRVPAAAVAPAPAASPAAPVTDPNAAPAAGPSVEKDVEPAAGPSPFARPVDDAHRR